MYTVRRLDKPPRPLKAQALKELAEDNGWTVNEGWQQVGVRPKPGAPILFIQTLRHPTEVRSVITVHWQRRQPTAAIGWRVVDESGRQGSGRFLAADRLDADDLSSAEVIDSMGRVQQTILMEGKPPEEGV
ncbi:hypothetical protein ACIO6U_03795 [Streptomyces sp. NPDC087422]|uniref:hypothetical protein n=1 Tax=Streptomyces sp. NPDC087422 TaxID=3365786 RepID=UPI003811601F